jgi:UDP-N-acetylmuramoyl-L-alanyl-D-glutamate--2,6-diaminopimelate ligase
LLESGPIDLELLAHAVHATRTANPAPVDVTDLAYDARRVTPGALFAASWMKADGHDYAPQAVADGAAALIVERTST